MVAKKTAVTVALLSAILISVLSGAVYYLDHSLANDNAKIASLNGQIASQRIEIANLTSQLADFQAQAANLTADLGVVELNATVAPKPLSYNALFIKGTVFNAGNMSAYNVGLKVVAYSSDGTLEINMTAPLVHGRDFSNDPPYGGTVFFGTDKATLAYANTLVGQR